MDYDGDVSNNNSISHESAMEESCMDEECFTFPSVERRRQRIEHQANVLCKLNLDVIKDK